MKKVPRSIACWTTLKKLIQDSSKILIVTHLDPDGDAVCSLLAFNLFVRSFNKIPQLFCADEIPERYYFLHGCRSIRRTFTEPYDLLIVLDTARLKRITDDFFPRHNQIINIDHHKSNDYFGKLNIIEPRASSTCEIIYRLFKKNYFPINRVLAEILYSGIFAETGGFTYANTTPVAFEVASELVKKGISPFRIAQHLMSRSEAGFKLLGLVLGTLKVRDGLGTIHLTRKMLKATKAKLNESENFVSLILTVRGVNVAVFIRESEDGRLKVSLRSDGTTDVDRIARHFGGGGHKTAAGFRTSKSLAQIEREIYKTIAVAR